MDCDLKKKSKTLYGVCICIIVLMVICYFGVSNTKGTYSAGTCPSGYEDNGTNCSYKVEAYYDYNRATSSDPSAPCTMGGTGKFISCSEKKTYDDDGEEVIKYYCVGTCYVNYVSDGRCYKANHRYLWSTTNPGSSYMEVSNISQSDCTGCESGYSENADGDCVANQLSSSVTLTFMNGSTEVKSQSCTIPSGASKCSSDIIAPGAQTKTGDTTGEYTFNGWGEKDGCETGSYTANAAFAPSVSKTYYACYRKSSNDVTSSDFDSSKCTYSSLYTVTRDERYLNCKYTNITYNNSATENIVGNVSACCRNKGYTWVAENFTSSGYGNEYCIVCGSSSGGGNNGGGDSNPDNPSNPSGGNGNNVSENPQTGSVAIFMVWIIALGTLVYSFVYFKQSKFE